NKMQFRLALVCTAALLAACSQSNNVLLGRVEKTVGTHKIVVTDCYRTSVPQPEQLPGATWHYAPCRDADIWIRGDQLEVNGRSYGAIAQTDSVLVDHGVVSVKKERGEPRRQGRLRRYFLGFNFRLMFETLRESNELSVL